VRMSRKAVSPEVGTPYLYLSMVLPYLFRLIKKQV